MAIAKKPDSERVKGQTLTIRISPRTKFTLEMLARKQHRSVTAVIEWLTAQAAEEEFSFELNSVDPEGRPVVLKTSQLDYLWDADEVERLVNLADRASSLMTYDEELIWKIIRLEESFWLDSRVQFPERRSDETDQQLADRYFSLLPPTPRYRSLYLERDQQGHALFNRWLDLDLVRRALPEIKKTAQLEMTPEELHRIVEEVKNGIEIQQADPPGVQKARGRKKNQ